jgi:hypothetical protein
VIYVLLTQVAVDGEHNVSFLIAVITGAPKKKKSLIPHILTGENLNQTS